MDLVRVERYLEEHVGGPVILGHVEPEIMNLADGLTGAARYPFAMAEVSHGVGDGSPG